MASSGDNFQMSTSENGDLLRQKGTVSLVKKIISAEYKDLRGNYWGHYLQRKYPDDRNNNLI